MAVAGLDLDLVRLGRLGTGENTSGIRRVLDLERRIVELADRPGSA